MRRLALGVKPEHGDDFQLVMSIAVQDEAMKLLDVKVMIRIVPSLDKVYTPVITVPFCMLEQLLEFTIQKNPVFPPVHVPPKAHCKLSKLRSDPSTT